MSQLHKLIAKINESYTLINTLDENENDSDLELDNKVHTHDLVIGSPTSTIDEIKHMVSVVNIQEEPSMKNIPNTRYSSDSQTYIKKNPKVVLNYYLMFSHVAPDFNDIQYQNGLIMVQNVINLFQKDRVIVLEDDTKVVFELYSPSFEQLNQIWSINGGKYHPSVIYKARVFEFEGVAKLNEVEAITEITKTLKHEN